MICCAMTDSIASDSAVLINVRQEGFRSKATLKQAMIDGQG